MPQISPANDIRAIALSGDALQTRFKSYADFIAALRALMDEEAEARRRAAAHAAFASTTAVRVEEAGAALIAVQRRLDEVTARLRRECGTVPG